MHKCVSHVTRAFIFFRKYKICFIVLLGTKRTQKYHNKQTLHLPQILSAHSLAVHANLLYRTLSKCQSPTSKHVSELSENTSCYITELILIYKQVIFSYFQAGLRAFRKYLLLYNGTHHDVQASYLLLLPSRSQSFRKYFLPYNGAHLDV
jgi:hypothetical protein